MRSDFEPRIVGFLCNWCAYPAVDLAGTSRLQYPTNVDIVRVMCSGRVEPAFVLKAFQLRADGVLICGCRLGDCNYSDGNYKTIRWIMMLRKVLEQFNFEPERLRLEWISASESEQFAGIVNEMTEKLKMLGPLSHNEKD